MSESFILCVVYRSWFLNVRFRYNEIQFINYLYDTRWKEFFLRIGQLNLFSSSFSEIWRSHKRFNAKGYVRSKRLFIKKFYLLKFFNKYLEMSYHFYSRNYLK